MTGAARTAGDVVVVLCTAPAAAREGRLGAAELAQQVVQERLCACANVMPSVQSFFWWQGRVDTAAESLLVLKTTRAVAGRLRERLLQLHPYDLPEVLELPVEGGHAPYLDWVRASLTLEPG